MELRVKELCKMRGMSLSALATKMGVDLSNLSASIKGNPTLERLSDIAKNLGVSVYDLFPKPSEQSGLVALADINGECIKITTADEWVRASAKIPGLITIPLYEKDSDLMAALRKLVKDGIKNMNEDSMMGQLGSHEIFCLSRRTYTDYDPELEEYTEQLSFTLTVLGKGWTHVYDLCEYGLDGEYDIDSDMGIVMEMRNEIEACFESCISALE